MSPDKEFKLLQSKPLENPCNSVFSLASSVYKPEELLPQTLLESWWQRYPPLFFLAYDEGKLCGYSSAFPVSKQAFQTTLEPDFNEKNLLPISISEFAAKADYAMYFSSIVVHPGWQGQGVSKALRLAFLEHLLSLWQEGRQVSQLSALVVSELGANMMSSLGIRFLHEANAGTLFYARHTRATLSKCLESLGSSAVKLEP